MVGVRCHSSLSLSRRLAPGTNEPHLLMSPPFSSHFLLRHVLLPDAMPRFRCAAVNAAAIAAKFSAAAEINEEFNGVVEVKKKVGDFEAKIE